MIKKTLLALVAMVMCLPFMVKAQEAPKAFLTIFEDEIGTFPHELTEEQCALVFEKGETFTIALDVTIGKLSGRNALVCACDPTKASVTSAIGANPSPYVAVGTNGSVMDYITSSRGGDHYSASTKLQEGECYKIVYVFDKNAKTMRGYLNGNLEKTFLNNSTAFQDFKHLSTNDDTKDNATILIGAGQVTSGGQVSSWDTAQGEIEIHSVEFFDVALTQQQVQNILYPREDPLFTQRRDAKASIAEAVATLKNQPGYYSCTINDVKVYDEATVHAAIDAAQSEDEINTIVGAVYAKTLILPEVGKAYRISYDFGANGVKYMQCVSAGISNKAGAPLLSNEKGENSIFLVTQEGENLRIQAYATGQYLKHDSRDRGFHETGGNVTFEQGSSLGKLKIKGNYY